MVYPPKETIAELSGFSRIQVGDVLLTGTPSGCALKAPGKLKQIFASFLPEHKKWEVFIKGQKTKRIFTTWRCYQSKHSHSRWKNQFGRTNPSGETRMN